MMNLLITLKLIIISKKNVSVQALGVEMLSASQSYS